MCQHLGRRRLQRSAAASKCARGSAAQTGNRTHLDSHHSVRSAGRSQSRSQAAHLPARAAANRAAGLGRAREWFVCLDRARPILRRDQKQPRPRRSRPSFPAGHCPCRCASRLGLLGRATECGIPQRNPLPDLQSRQRSGDRGCGEPRSWRRRRPADQRDDRGVSNRPLLTRQPGR